MSNYKSIEKTIKFKGGIHPKEGKELAEKSAITEAPLLANYKIVIHQNIGAPPKLLVKKGDEVKKGQMIAEAGGFVSVPLHAPTSGKIAAIEYIPGVMGIMVEAISIDADGEDAWGELAPAIDWKNASPDDLKKRICDCGIVGMGGAAFPSHVKLSPPPDKTVDTLILNGAECEPYLTADHRLMLEQPEKVLEGAAILARAVGVTNVFVGVENNKQDAIDALKEKADAYGVKVIPLRVKYPQGAEKQLIYAITGLKVPAGALPMDVGCVVQNVGTAAAVTDAVKEGKPLIDRVTSVTGEPVANPSNLLLKLGTTVEDAIKLVGGVKGDVGKVILGGPMMGFAQKSLHVTVQKNTSGILLLSPDDVVQYKSEPCIRCGRCVDSCAMNLLPGTLSTLIESENFELAGQYNVMDCLECGSCAYVCPSHRPLIQHFRRAKAELRKKK
jgi:H+/Na+-translocating ferredoxin:NAD+ oxidoreductase subunit C